MAKPVGGTSGEQGPDTLVHEITPRRSFVERVTPDQLDLIFNDVLRRDDVKPSRGVYEEIARNIDRYGESLRPYLISDEQRRREARVWDAAADFLLEIEEWAKVSPEYSQQDAEFSHPFMRVAHLLEHFGVIPIRRGKPSTPRGRPNESWHDHGHVFARIISDSLRNIGYRRSLSKVKENSATVIICSRVVGIVFGIDVSAAGFASAMRKRDRRKKNCPSMEELFKSYPQISE